MEKKIKVIVSYGEFLDFFSQNIYWEGNFKRILHIIQ